jgi:hypothetical protein
MSQEARSVILVVKPINFEALSVATFTLLPDTKACEMNRERYAFGE